MALKEGNQTIQVTMPEFHRKKLAMMCSKLGLKKSEVLQRLIEQYNVFQQKEVEEKE